MPGGLPKAGDVCLEGVYLGGCVCQTSPSPVDRMKDTCKNNTLPQLRQFHYVADGNNSVNVEFC